MEGKLQRIKGNIYRIGCGYCDNKTCEFLETNKWVRFWGFVGFCRMMVDEAEKKETGMKVSTVFCGKQA